MGDRPLPTVAVEASEVVIESRHVDIVLTLEIHAESELQDRVIIVKLEDTQVCDQVSQCMIS